MTKNKPFKNLKDITGYINKIRPIFLVEQYELKVLEQKEDHRDNQYICADMTVRHDYLDAVMNIYPWFYKQPLIDQKKTIVHEMCHFLTLLQAQVVEDMLDGKLVTGKHADEVLEKENSWMERILCTSLKKELGLYKQRA